MSWEGVQAEQSFVNRARRVVVNPDCAASVARRTGLRQILLELLEHLGQLLRDLGASTEARTSCEKPISPITLPSSLRNGSFDVRHHTGSLGRNNCSSR